MIKTEAWSGKNDTHISWMVKFTNKAAKQAQKLDERILIVLQALTEDLADKGPAPGKNWPNYGKLKGDRNSDRRHCHLIKSSPTYVCCWKVIKAEKRMEIYYVGTHEKAPY